MKPTKLCLVATLLGLVACPWSERLESDPSAWSPNSEPEQDAASISPEVDGSAGAHDAMIDEQAPEAAVGCTSDGGPDPAYDPTLKISTSSLMSHRPGQACLTGCHAQGGTARLVLAVGGTVYQSDGSHLLAQAGKQVQQIGGTTLTVDLCGDVYATPNALVTSPNQTQPVVDDPTLRQMQKFLDHEAQPGNCNQSGCHDFSSSVNWGIYF